MPAVIFFLEQESQALHVIFKQGILYLLPQEGEELDSLDNYEPLHV